MPRKPRASGLLTLESGPLAMGKQLKGPEMPRKPRARTTLRVGISLAAWKGRKGSKMQKVESQWTTLERTTSLQWCKGRKGARNAEDGASGTHLLKSRPLAAVGK